MTSSPTVQISFPGTYVLTTGYKDYIVDCATGNIAVTLPTITSSGTVVNITRNDTGVTGNTGNTLTVSPSTTQVINRQSTPVVQANLNQLRFVSYITATETGWFYGASSATLLSIENLTFTSPAVTTISPIIDVTDITNYNYNALPSGSLVDGLVGKAKNFTLSNDKVAPVQVTTDRGAFVLSNQSINKTQLVFTDGFWKQLAGDDLTIFPTKQQGTKLVGTGNTGAPRQGTSVALSADGNTLAIGGPSDNGGQGATWIFARSGSPSIWTQQGPKLVGAGAIGSSNQGTSVALSADGNTLAIGGPGDNSNQGATWIFTRTAGSWIQQAKLLGTSVSIANNGRGDSVALSADGNTLAVGGPGDNSNQGATWIFARTGVIWTQQGNKLVGSGGGFGSISQGDSVALSADGNTLAIGGSTDSFNQGATWIFIRTAGVWSQQGNKLVANDPAGTARQGFSVSLSANGNTLAVGGFTDNSNQGAAWIFIRSGAPVSWSQQGTKLVGNDAVGAARQGTAVCLSSDGNTLISGGPSDNLSVGASWIFIRSGSPASWRQQGTKLVGSPPVSSSNQGTSVSLSADANTLAVGGPGIPGSIGDTWIFV